MAGILTLLDAAEIIAGKKIGNWKFPLSHQYTLLHIYLLSDVLVGVEIHLSIFPLSHQYTLLHIYLLSDVLVGVEIHLCIFPLSRQYTLLHPLSVLLSILHQFLETKYNFRIKEINKFTFIQVGEIPKTASATTNLFAM